MGFNYTKEKAKFDHKWAKLRCEYEKAGMSVTAINQIYNFDWQWFLSRRTYCARTQPLPDLNILEAEEANHSSLLKKFQTLSTTFDEQDFQKHDAWMELLEDQRLIAGLKRMDTKDLELLAFLILEGHTQAELAAKWRCSQNAVCKRLKKIIKVFNKWL